jgi:hypothetical protein
LLFSSKIGDGIHLNAGSLKWMPIIFKWFSHPKPTWSSHPGVAHCTSLHLWVCPRQAAQEVHTERAWRFAVGLTLHCMGLYQPSYGQHMLTHEHDMNQWWQNHITWNKCLIMVIIMVNNGSLMFNHGWSVMLNIGWWSYSGKNIVNTVTQWIVDFGNKVMRV